MLALGGVLAYLLGSVDFGILVSKYLYHDDIRTHGSGNAGSTNIPVSYTHLQDQEVASMLRRCGKPVIVAVNKCDKVGDAPMELYDFYTLGLGELIPVSSVHGHGTGEDVYKRQYLISSNRRSMRWPVLALMKMMGA